MRIALIWLLLSLSVWGDQQVEKIFAQARHLNPTMTDCSATLEADLDATIGMLHDKRKMPGTYYFKRDDRHKLDLPSAPSYIKRHASSFAFSLPSLTRFDARVAEEGDRDGQPTWKILLTPRKVEPDIDRIEMWVNRKNYTVPQYEVFYNKNGKLNISMQYQETKGFWVLEHARAELSIPAIFLSSVALMHYQNYQFNQGLADELFQPDPRKRSR